jgi:anti-sigma regulatory factor (Ser/Thr protein kinase)
LDTGATSISPKASATPLPRADSTRPVQSKHTSDVAHKGYWSSPVGTYDGKEDFLPEHALRALPTSIAEARKRVRDRLGGVLEPKKLAEAELLTSELVTNAVRYAQVNDEAMIEIDFEVEAATVRVRVVDAGPGFDFGKILRTSPGEPGGWGLFLVEALADRWGIDPPSPHCVWFEIDR